MPHPREYPGLSCGSTATSLSFADRQAPCRKVIDPAHIGLGNLSMGLGLVLPIRCRPKTSTVFFATQQIMEPQGGVEPPTEDYKSTIFPLNYNGIFPMCMVCTYPFSIAASRYATVWYPCFSFCGHNGFIFHSCFHAYDRLFVYRFASKYTERMYGVFFRCTPFEIIHSIICFVSVFVVYERFSGYSGYECFGYSSMPINHKPFSIFAQIKPDISFIIDLAKVNLSCAFPHYSS